MQNYEVDFLAQQKHERILSRSENCSQFKEREFYSDTSYFSLLLVIESVFFQAHLGLKLHPSLNCRKSYSQGRKKVFKC